MSSLPSIIFDTTGINSLEDGGPASELLMRGLECGFDVILTATSGRNDLMMATYLPYCGRFVTADWAQRKDLHEIAAAAKTDCEVLSFEEFNLSFAVVA